MKTKPRNMTVQEAKEERLAKETIFDQVILALQKVEGNPFHISTFRERITHALEALTGLREYVDFPQIRPLERKLSCLSLDLRLMDAEYQVNAKNDIITECFKRIEDQDEKIKWLNEALKKARSKIGETSQD